MLSAGPLLLYWKVLSLFRMTVPVSVHQVRGGIEVAFPRDSLPSPEDKQIQSWVV
jgi:hypothetical protein